MDMTEDNEQLLKQFFSETAQQTIADDGFTERVMQRLPMRANWFVRLWDGLCLLVAAILFIVYDGWQLLADHVVGLFYSLIATSPTQIFLTVAALVFGLLFVGVGELLYAESVRRPWLR
jgi:hypothetical protein